MADRIFSTRRLRGGNPIFADPGAAGEVAREQYFGALPAPVVTHALAGEASAGFAATGAVGLRIALAASAIVAFDARGEIVTITAQPVSRRRRAWVDIEKWKRANEVAPPEPVPALVVQSALEPIAALPTDMARVMGLDPALLALAVYAVAEDEDDLELLLMGSF